MEQEAAAGLIRHVVTARSILTRRPMMAGKVVGAISKWGVCRSVEVDAEWQANRNRAFRAMMDAMLNSVPLREADGMPGYVEADRPTIEGTRE